MKSALAALAVCASSVYGMETLMTKKQQQLPTKAPNSHPLGITLVLAASVSKHER